MLRLPSWDLLPVLPADKLGLDLIEIGWADATPDVPGKLLDHESPHIVLSGADTQDAVRWGRGHGIAMFEGRAALAGQPATRSAVPAR
jgi:hypothetical protein